MYKFWLIYINCDIHTISAQGLAPTATAFPLHTERPPPPLSKQAAKASPPPAHPPSSRFRLARVDFHVREMLAVTRPRNARSARCRLSNRTRWGMYVQSMASSTSKSVFLCTAYFVAADALAHRTPHCMWRFLAPTHARYRLCSSHA